LIQRNLTRNWFIDPIVLYGNCGMKQNVLELGIELELTGLGAATRPPCPM